MASLFGAAVVVHTTRWLPRLASSVAWSVPARLLRTSVPVRHAASQATATAAAASSEKSPVKQSGPIGVELARGATAAKQPRGDDACGVVEEDDDDMVPMIDATTGEWGGPTKGGVMPEPTRFGDWERKGRCTDFV